MLQDIFSLIIPPLPCRNSPIFSDYTNFVKSCFMSPHKWPVDKTWNVHTIDSVSSHECLCSTLSCVFPNSQFTSPLRSSVFVCLCMCTEDVRDVGYFWGKARGWNNTGKSLLSTHRLWLYPKVARVVYLQDLKHVVLAPVTSSHSSRSWPGLTALGRLGLNPLLGNVWPHVAWGCNPLPGRLKCGKGTNRPTPSTAWANHPPCRRPNDYWSRNQN